MGKQVDDKGGRKGVNRVQPFRDHVSFSLLGGPSRINAGITRVRMENNVVLIRSRSEIGRKFSNLSSRFSD